MTDCLIAIQTDGQNDGHRTVTQTLPHTMRTVSIICQDSNVNVNVNGEFKVTLYEQVRYRGTLQY